MHFRHTPEVLALAIEIVAVEAVPSAFSRSALMGE